MKNVTMSGHAVLAIIHEMLSQHHSEKYPVRSALKFLRKYSEVAQVWNIKSWSDGTSVSEVVILRRYGACGDVGSLCGFHMDTLQRKNNGMVLIDGSFHLQISRRYRAKVRFEALIHTRTITKLVNSLVCGLSSYQTAKIERRQYDSLG